jgi:hypothetical protein
LFQLAAQPDVLNMLKSTEYTSIKEDYDRLSRIHFERGYFYPDDMRFANSDALFPPADSATILGVEYAAQCQLLCYGPCPNWAEVQARLVELRDLL